MAENSKIEWTDHTFNPWIGCMKVSDGCKHCYAEAMMDKRLGKAEWGPQGKRVRTSPTNWKQPLKWNKEQWLACGVCNWRGTTKQVKVADGFVCPDCGAEPQPTRARVFCASLADVFEDKADQRDEMDDWRIDLFELIEATPNLDWLLLTKRPQNVNYMMPVDNWVYNYSMGHPSNIWIGTSVENQEQADKRIPELLKVPAAVRFLSMEPLLGPVELHLHGIVPETISGHWYRPVHSYIDWVIVGGESGHNARPMHPDWVRSLRDQCNEAYVSFFFKQWGEWVHESQATTEMVSAPKFSKDLMVKTESDIGFFGRRSPNRIHTNGGFDYYKVGKHKAGRMLDGREWNEVPGKDFF